MKWLEFSIQVPRDLLAPLASLFHTYGHGGIALENFTLEDIDSLNSTDSTTLRTYIPLNRSAARRRQRIILGVELASLIQSLPSLQEREIDENEWIEGWKEHFPLLHIGNQLIVRSSWHTYLPKPGDIILNLDPGLAFGTGHHPTTHMSLKILESVVRPKQSILDIGTGSGILAIASINLGASSAVGIDTDSTAIRIARANAKKNVISGKIRVLHASLQSQRLSNQWFDLILANISSQFLLENASALIDFLPAHGILIASGFTINEEPEVMAILSSVGFSVLHRLVSENWICIAMTTMPQGNVAC